MSSPVLLAIDGNTKQLVNFNGSATALPDFYQSNSQLFRVQVVDKSANVIDAYTVRDLTGAGLRMAIGDTPTGASGGPTPLALQDTFTWDSDNKWFYATLAFNVVAVDTFIGSAASKTAYLEINLTESGSRTTLLQQTFTLKAVVDELTSVAPTPTDQYLTKAEILNQFVKKVGDAGEKIVLKSPNGVYGLEFGVNDDGTVDMDVITL
jgi:hypothetical protein